MNNSSSGYDRDLFDRVLSGMDDPAERVKTVLLWRGFLARNDVDRVFLCTGSLDADLEMLKQLGFSVQNIDGHPENYAEIVSPNLIEAETLFELFNRQPEHVVLGGPFHFTGV